MKNFKDKVDKIMDSSLSNHLIFIDCHYGYNTTELINSKIKELEIDGKVLIIYHGDRNFKELKDEFEMSSITLMDHIAFPNIEKNIVIADAYGELITIYEGEMMLSKYISGLEASHFEAVFVMNVNYMFMPLLDTLNLHFLMAPIICIGDSEGYISDSDVLKALANTEYFYNDVYRMKGYNVDILYYIKKIRTGSVNRLDRSVSRDLTVVKIDDTSDYFNLDEVMDYSIVVDTTGNFREFNSAMRMDLGFTFIPNINEPMVNIVPFIAKTTTGKDIAVDAYNIFKVKRISKEGGILRILVEHRDQNIEIPLNTNYLANISDTEVPIDIAEHDAGVKMEYAYFIPPRVAVNKSFMDVLIYFKNSSNTYARKLLINVLSSCIRSFKIKTDYEYYL